MYKLLTNVTGVDSIFLYVNSVTDFWFVRLLLLAIWCIITFGSYFIQKESTGLGDFPVSMMVGSFVTLVTAILMRLVPDLVDGYTIAFCIIVSALSFLFLMFSKD